MPTPFSTWRPHPWHGLPSGPEPPSLVNVFVEITPFDLIKYEVDKATGYLKVDRPQRTSSLPPSIYGFVPQTYCGPKVAKMMPGAERGDGDPLDICVLSERPITRAEVLLQARVVGGLPMLDRGEADDKILSILKDDPAFGAIQEVDEIPAPLIDRLMHYFSTYKLGRDHVQPVRLGAPYGREHAEAVINASIEDYRAEYGERFGRVTRVTSLAPVVAANAHALILGSMPGEVSLARGEYYAHPRNRFWLLMAEVCGAGPELAYGARLARLGECRIALWDVLEHCERAGSLDTSIRSDSEVPNDFAGLFARHESIRVVALNGAKAARTFRRRVVPQLAAETLDRLTLLDMPSTSPANASWSLEDLLVAWRRLKPLLDLRPIPPSAPPAII